MKKRNITIDDVAQRAGVSIKTVSRVFNREPNVRPATRDKVLAAAKELDYWPNLSARRLASNRSFVIGLLYDNPQSDYVTDIQHGSLEVCRREGYHLLIHPCTNAAPDLVEEALGLHRQTTVDGFILTQPVADWKPLTRALAESGIRFVRVSQRHSDQISPCISGDDEQAAYKMTAHLISLGHRRIGFIMGHPDHGSSHERLRGYHAALDQYQLPPSSALVEQGLYNFESGYSCARRLLSSRPRPTAIFASNDHMAMGVLTAAHEQQLRVPADLSVGGFDDTPMARYAWPPLTTVRQPIREIARLATEVLVKVLRGDEPGERAYRLRSELIPRGSTGKCPS
ncbi:MAG: LacI family transcriptional regulator [bacterium]|nr:LacI family transcriptional regulator [bacterium]